MGRIALEWDLSNLPDPFTGDVPPPVCAALALVTPKALDGASNFLNENSEIRNLVFNLLAGNISGLIFEEKTRDLMGGGDFSGINRIVGAYSAGVQLYVSD